MSYDPDQLKNQILSKLKTFSETMTESVGNYAKGKPVFCSQEVISQRMSVCNACPDFVKATSQCKKCGCFMSAKTKLKAASCPVMKWGKDN
jgi:hypothetical protein